MNLTLQLSAELEAKLREQAQATGKPPEDLALEALTERFSITEPEPAKLPLEMWLAELDALASATPAGNLNADFSRDSIYEGCGE